jgi:hypothetical protein
MEIFSSPGDVERLQDKLADRDPYFVYKIFHSVKKTYFSVIMI